MVQGAKLQMAVESTRNMHTLVEARVARRKPGKTGAKAGVNQIGGGFPGWPTPRPACCWGQEIIQRWQWT